MKKLDIFFFLEFVPNFLLQLKANRSKVGQRDGGEPLKAGWPVFPVLLLFLPLLLFSPSPQSKSDRWKKAKTKLRGFLSLTANSHKFVLNMSSIDWTCRMNTIKETTLSAAHLGGGEKGEEEGGMEGYTVFLVLLSSRRGLCVCECVHPSLRSFSDSSSHPAFSYFLASIRCCRSSDWRREGAMKERRGGMWKKRTRGGRGAATCMRC